MGLRHEGGAAATRRAVGEEDEEDGALARVAGAGPDTVVGEPGPNIDVPAFYFTKKRGKVKLSKEAKKKE